MRSIMRAGVGSLTALVLAGTLAPGVTHAAPNPVQASAGHEVTAGPVIVDVAAGTTPQQVAAEYGITPTAVYTEAIAGFAAVVTDTQLAALAVDRRVESVTADKVVFRSDPTEVVRAASRPVAARSSQSGRTPAPIATAGEIPPGEFEQYVQPEIRRVRASVSKTADIDGIDDRRVAAGIAIVDSGIGLGQRDLNVVGGVDCVAGPKRQRSYDDRGDGHGTAVAGLAAAIDNPYGVVGTAPGARLYAVRVADVFGGVTDSALLCGLEWVIRHADVVDVANLSLSGTGNVIGPCTDPKKMKHDRYGKRAAVDRIHQKICRATNRGVTIVAAAGNDSMDASTVTPAAYDEVISVSAFTDFDGLPGAKYGPAPPECDPNTADDTFAYFSNHGPVVDISAPGECNFTTGPVESMYGYVEGTSFAAPLVAGGAALIAANNPSMSPAQVRARLVALAIRGTVTGDPDGRDEGVLNAGPL